MTPLARTRLAFVTTAVTAAVMVLATMPVQAAGEHRADRQPVPTNLQAPAVARAKADGDTIFNTVKVKWSGDVRQGRYTRAGVVPGIGNVQIVCRANKTMVKLYANDHTAETQMWMSKYEVKNGRDVVAVKNVRIYKYATADDDGTGGTGPASHEGLNQGDNPLGGGVENRAQGYAHGIISQRPGRHQPAGTTDLAPVTSFRLTWFWNGLDYPKEYQSCKVRMRMRTELQERIGLNWHGDNDSVGNTVKTTTIPGFGDLRLNCETGRDGDQSISLLTASSDAKVWVEYVEGEGQVENQVSAFELGHDPVTGSVGPLEIPQNGMMRLYYTVDGVTRAFILSSYVVANNAKKPENNVCEIAVAAFTG